NLVFREFLPATLVDGVHRNLRAVVQDDGCRDSFAEPFVRQPDHHAARNAGKPVEHPLHFGRVDIGATTHDDDIAPVHAVTPALIVHETNFAGAQYAAGRQRLAGLGSLPVPQGRSIKAGVRTIRRRTDADIPGPIPLRTFDRDLQMWQHLATGVGREAAVR